MSASLNPVSGGPLPSAAIGLRNFGSPVAVWVSDGGDGVFGRGDRVTFIGEVLRGTYSFLDPYSRFNCYRLSFDDEDPRRGESLTSARTRFEEPARFLAKHHLESDRVMVRFRMKSDDPEESWYWERLSVADKEPFRQELVFEGFARSDDNDPKRHSLGRRSCRSRSDWPSGRTGNRPGEFARVSNRSSKRRRSPRTRLVYDSAWG